MISLEDKIVSYVDLYLKGITDIRVPNIQLAIDALKKAADNSRNIFVGGNGGSAAIANHLVCDFMKGTDHANFFPLRVVSLSANMALITAIANDLSYKETLSFQLQRLIQSKDDVALLISSSGNSPNIMEAAKVLKSRGVTLIGMSGFDGGQLAKIADISLHVPINNYGVVEDCHQSLMHIISQRILEERTQSCQHQT